VSGPLGPERADIQAGIIAATIANANRGKKGRRFVPKDFIPKWDRGAVQPWEQQLAIVKAMNAALKGADHTRG
jgi:hypothetical protein